MPKYIVAAGGSNFVKKYAIFTSNDLATWTAVSTPLDYNGNSEAALCLAQHGSRIVAGGQNGTTSGLHPLIYTDDGGVTWSTVTSPFDNSGSAGVVRGIYYDAGQALWMAVGTKGGLGNPMVCTSTDGTTWTQVGTPNVRQPNCVIYAAGYWWVGGRSGTGFHCLAKSNDGGATWTSVTNAFFDGSSSAGEILCLAYNGSLIVAGGYQGTSLRAVTVQTSPDGTTWTARSCGLDKQPGEPSGGTCYSAVWSAALSLWVAGGINQAPAGDVPYCTSPDGITWTNRSVVAQFATTRVGVGMAWNPDDAILAAVGGSAGCSSSPDGITWTTAGAPSNGQGIGNAILYNVPPKISEAGAISPSGALSVLRVKLLSASGATSPAGTVTHTVIHPSATPKGVPGFIYGG